jgi:copper chaperone NosL
VKRLGNYSALVLIMIVAAFSAAATADDDIEQHRSCAQCGMDRKAYAYSRMLIIYEDGAAGVCSLHCAAKELASHSTRTVREILSADRNSRALLPARTAVWVMGGSKRGVMTTVPKWAFRAKDDAEAFVRTFGVKIITWEEALAEANKEP